MNKAKCFNCGIILEGVGRSMEFLIDNKMPLFCCGNCADAFPTDDDEKEIRFIRLKKGEFTI